MKLVKAIIRPERFGVVRKALEENGFLGMTITSVEGHDGRNLLTRDTCEGLKPFDLHPKIQIELVVNNTNVDHLLSIIAESCHTGNPGDGRIFVMHVDKTIRIRTGESLDESQVGRTIGTATYEISDLSTGVTEGSIQDSGSSNLRISAKKR